DVTAWHCVADRYPGIVPIGRPIDNLSIYVLDAHGEPVPMGVAGEIYIGGVGVARGYLNREELTAERFLTDPFRAGGRMYRTGDLGRWLAGGEVEYLGRNDHQVKLRGFRIELGEIEARLAQVEGVREAVVLARMDTPGETRLVAYVTGAQAVEVPVLREALLAHLPEYMVPAAYVWMERLPLTSNGKLDRRALPAPQAQAYAAQAYEAPQGEVETALARIWQETLGAEQVGRHDDFFALGGHSMLAVNLLSRMAREGFQCDVQALFAHPTVAGVAALANPSRHSAVPLNGIVAGCTRITPSMLTLIELEQPAIDRITATVPGGAANVEDIYPLAPLQDGILYHHIAAERGDPYLLSAMLAMDSLQRVEAFAAALNQVVVRHAVLRTAIAWDGLDQPVQLVWRDAPLTVEVLQLDPAQGDIAAQLRKRFDPRHFRLDIRQAPMMRLITAQDVPGGRWVTMLLSHHLIDDATSLKLMIGEIAGHLEGREAPQSTPMPYRDYVARAIALDRNDEQKAFFRAMLADVDEPTLPFGLTQGGDIEESVQMLGAALGMRLRTLARRYGVSVASLHHLAWAQVVGSLSGREDVVFGTVLLGRLQGGQGIESALGMFINMLPLRVRIGDRDIAACVKATHEHLLALLVHEHMPLAQAQRCSGVAAPAPLFGALLNYRHGVDPAAAGEASDGWRGIDLLAMEERTNYPLTLAVDDFGDDFRLTVQVVAGVGAQRIGEYMATVLAGLAQALEREESGRMRDLPVLPAQEREQVLHAWNATEVEQGDKGTFPDLFAAQVAQTPDAWAVQAGEARLSYRELNEQANQLAHRLIELGVGADDRVALCVERGVGMMVGLLGILKSGAGYVPLDPAYPSERLAWMLEDSAPSALVVSEATRGVVEDVGVQIVEIVDLDDAAWRSQPVHDPRVTVQPHHLAYVLYTSGSTGRPKGVMVEHGNLANLLQAMRGLTGIAAGDGLLAVTTLGFDIAGLELYLPLVVGARTIVLDRESARDATLLARALDDSGATLMQATPSTWRMLVEGGWPGSAGLTALCGGEALPAQLAAQLRARVGTLWNVYGPTETTIWSSAQRVEGAVNIGRPIDNTQFYLLDAHGEPVPMGVAGEIYIGGAGVARGYLNREDLTAERFLADPFRAGGRMYRTGDLGRWLPEGEIEYLGRNDHQVKLRGFRIELGEIEARLAQVEGVR
ncbi:amino acid adenylation domain-containing protein, partial [Pseudomonas entomophila]|uniref:amino acid adenylation domain-containing protein n=1 Tax=Pseudomonas entomophila TaxID=312306 RepID=UPI0023D84339